MKMTKPALAIAMMAFAACSGGSKFPTTPNVPDGSSEEPTEPSEKVMQQEPTAFGDVTDLREALAVLGGTSDLVSMWDPKAKVKLVTAPPTGSTFKVLSSGSLKQPLPKFKIEVVPSHKVSEGTVIVFFLTASGKECGIGVSYPLVPLKANTAKQLTPSIFIAGPEVCSVLGPPCSASACKLPLTTTKFRMHFGGDYKAFAQKTVTRTYRWEK